MKTLINQTQAIIQLEISHVLEEYPHHPYQQLFANPDRRQELIAYVLNHVSSIYSCIDVEPTYFSGYEKPDFISSTPFPTIVALTIETLVHRGIRVLLDRNASLHEIPEVSESNRMASSWFG